MVFCPILFVRNESVGPILTQGKRLHAGMETGGALSEATDHISIYFHGCGFTWSQVPYDSLGLGH